MCMELSEMKTGILRVKIHQGFTSIIIVTLNRGTENIVKSAIRPINYHQCYFEKINIIIIIIIIFIYCRSFGSSRWLIKIDTFKPNK